MKAVALTFALGATVLHPVTVDTPPPIAIPNCHSRVCWALAKSGVSLMALCHHYSLGNAVQGTIYTDSFGDPQGTVECQRGRLVAHWSKK